MPPLEMMGPGGGFSMLLSPMLAESPLAGGDGGIQLPLDDGSASSSAGDGQRLRSDGGFCMALD
jgi:hypothetical protein